MKKIIILLLISYSSISLFGQQLPQYSLYLFNNVILNPASLSQEKDNKIIFMLRDQWGSFDGAPFTQSISYYNVNNEKYKRGISIINDVTGPISILNATLLAEYTIPSFRNDFSFGASATFMQYKFDNSQIDLENDGILDPTIFGGIEKVNGNSFTIGSYYYAPKYFIGLSIPNIVGSSLEIGNNKNNNELQTHYYLNSGLNIDLKNKNKLVPSILVKKIGALPVQIDLNLKTIYQDFLWGGISYRPNDAIIALFGMKINQLSFGYSYDITTSAIRIPSSGTHGLLLSFNFNKNPGDKDNDGILDFEDECPRIPGLVFLNGCPDKDRDGIKDSEDDCPEIFGLKINNGCPDTDGDGILDKNDTCISVFGLARYNGCPDTDGDGVEDRYDDCPEVFGSPFWKGCPKILLQDTLFITDTIFKIDTIYLAKNDNEYLKKEFDNIQFNFNKFSLTKKSKDILDRVAKYLNIKLKLRIYIEGHTDDIDNNSFNMILSENRVKSVMNYLVSKGVVKSRIKLGWKGESQPLINSKTESARALNRRVEVKVIDDN